MKKVYFVTNTLPRIHGGRTKSLLQRAKLLNHQGQNITIVSTNYNSEYDDIYEYFKKSNKVLDNTNFLNIYDYYKKINTTQYLVKKWETVLEREVGRLSNYNKVYRSKIGDRTYYYKDGKPYILIKTNKENVPEYFALYRDWNFKPYKYFLINKEGLIHRIDYYDEKSSLNFQEFLTVEGKIFLTKKFNNKKEIIKIRLKNNESFTEFFNEKDFICYFFNEIFNESDVVVNDARFLDIPLLKTRVAKRIFQMHNPHLDNPLDSYSKIKGSFSNILNSNFPDTDIIVSLTEKQKENIVSRIPSLHNNIVVIPHSTTVREIKYQRLTNHFGIISRLHPQKNLKDSIRGFKLFQKEYPNYFLDIYGDGESRNELMELVKELNIADRVIFHGNVENVDQAFQEIQTLLVTSDYEGFSLATLEAISNGTSVITYDVNYGPTDIIDDKSGWITKSRTPIELKNKMVESVKKPKIVKEVQDRSLVFSENEFVLKWLEVIK